MAGTDDPVFLRLTGPAGREFRLAREHGRSFARGKQSLLVLGGPKSDETNVAHPELNDPATPATDLADITGVCLVKGQEPLPNVRGVGEMDDRLLIERIEVELRGAGGTPTRRFERTGPVWLGLVCGLCLELAEAADPQ
jgi:hypothetical protein